MQQPWIYLNIVLRHSQLFLPVLDLVCTLSLCTSLSDSWNDNTHTEHPYPCDTLKFYLIFSAAFALPSQA